MTPVCVVPGCDHGIRVRSLCNTHACAFYEGRLPQAYVDLIPPARGEFTGPYCDCETSQMEHVSLFGWVTCIDVVQCSTCGRPPKPDP